MSTYDTTAVVLIFHVWKNNTWVNELWWLDTHLRVFTL